MSRRVAVVGAGWSGLACALELARGGCAVALFDAAPQAGGRARAVDCRLGERRFRLDNGQHLLIGAYRETLRLLRDLGVDIDAALLRLPFAIRYPDGFVLRTRRLPAPWHLAAALLSARGLSWSTRRSALRSVGRWRRMGWRVPVDAPATTLFADAPAELLRRLWRPLCLAALNVEPAQASAQVLLNVLRDSLCGSAQDSDLLVPRHDLSRLFVEPAMATLKRHGAVVHLRSNVQRLSPTRSGWAIDRRGGSFDADAVVLALAPHRAADLLAGSNQASLTGVVSALREVAPASIATAYLRYAESTRLDWPLYALLDDAASGNYGQWVFDRGALDTANAGVLGVVISAAAVAADRDAAQVTTAVAAQLGRELGLPAPLAATLIVEKRATIVPAPRLRRPAARLPAPGLYLAGDAADSEYPSTLEGSVRSGLAAARAVLADARPGR